MPVLWALLALLGLAAAAQAATVWIDTDVSIGSPIREVDDAYALVLAFHSPEIRIAGVSTTYGNAPLDHTTRVAREMVLRLGPRDVRSSNSVFAGAASARDLGRKSDASDALAAMLGKERLTYIALGPLTNLATFLQLHPKLASRIEHIVFLGGQAEGSSLTLGPTGTFRIHDANVFKDPAAVVMVLRSKIPLTLVPIAVASKLTLEASDLRQLEVSGDAASYLARRSRVWLWFWTQFAKTKGGAIFDALALVAATKPELLSIEKRSAGTDQGGNLVARKRLTKGFRTVRFCRDFAPETKGFVIKRLTARLKREYRKIDSARDDRDVGAGRQFQQSFLFQQERAARFDSDDAQIRFHSNPHGRHTDDRDVETHILVWLCHLHHDRVLAPERAAALDRFVSPLKTFHRQDGSISHDDGLADIEPADFPRDLETESDIVFFASSELAAGDQARGRQAIVEKTGRGQKRDPRAREFIADRGENGFRVAPLQFREEQQRLPVRSQIEKVLRGDLTRHDSLRHFRVPEACDHFSQLAHTHPVDLIHFRGEALVGFAGKGRGHDSLNPGATGSIGEKLGVNAVAGNDPEDAWNFHGTSLMMQRRLCQAPNRKTSA
ncbi:MAG: hypothetical protein QOH88_1521 [Verrucomicrobiota bacterium]|jgi:pyrimidine-specific ribonucleoside hydrolase